MSPLDSRDTGRATRRWRRSSGWWVSRASSGAACTSFRGGSSNGWRWRARWRRSRAFCSSRSRYRTWTPAVAAGYLDEVGRRDRLEGLARPETARVGDRVYLEAVRVLTFPEERA